MQLHSFGCSFIYGSELASRDNTWPALLAERLNLPHANHGIEGAGNLKILETVLDHARPDHLCVINWTWIDRFDFVNSLTEQWQTIVPSQQDYLAEIYYKKLQSQYKDMLTNLVYINTAIQYLLESRCTFYMTYMDALLFETVKPEWHASQAVHIMQRQVLPYLKNFQGQTFLEWSRLNGYAVSKLWHPLDRAHAAAADLVYDNIKKLLL